MKKRNIIVIILWIFLAIILGVIWMFSPSMLTRNILYETISLNKFDTTINDESTNIKEIHITRDNIGIIQMKNTEILLKTALPQSQKHIIKMILGKNIPLFLQSSGRVNTWQFVVVQIINAIVQLAVQIIYFRYIFGMRDNNEAPKRIIRKLKFSDIIAMDSQKEKLKDAYEYMINLEKFKKLGFSQKNGIIMHGPPGNGKTLLARALAGEFDCHFIGTTASEFVALYVGSGALKIREIYEEARANSPCIVFIDEVDAIGSRNSNNVNQEYHATINQLLVELDGTNNNDKVFTILATNLLDDIDAAILRSGRIGQKIHIGNPSINERKVIVNALVDKLPLSHRLSIDHITNMTTGASRADLVSLMEDSYAYAMKQSIKNKESIYDTVVKPEYVDEVMIQKEIGEKTELIFTEREVINTTYHEVGHAFVHYYYQDIFILQKMMMITIEPRDRVLGFVMYYDDEREMTNLNKLRSRICVSLAGTLAEKIFLNTRTPGCSSDIKYVRNLAETYIINGMNDDYGLHHMTHRRTYGSDSLMSEKEKEVIYNEVTKLINELTKVTYDILYANQDIIHKFVKVLRKQMTIRGDDIYRLFDNKEISTALVPIQWQPLYI